MLTLLAAWAFQAGAEVGATEEANGAVAEEQRGATEHSAAGISPIQSAKTKLDELRRDIEEANVHAAVGRLEHCHRELSTLAEQADSDDDVHYDLAFASWRLNQALYGGVRDPKRSEALLAQAREELEQLVKHRPEHVEALALLASVYGQMIGDSPARGMMLGPKAGRVLDRAQRLSPENPRVALQRGVSMLFTPAMFGGGAKKAITELERARRLFAEQAGDTEWPNWGQLDAHAWLGQALAKVGRTEDARRVYQQALTLEPDSAWIRYALLPDLDN